MSDYSLSSAFIDVWAEEIKLAFQQSKSLLRDTVTVKNAGAHNVHFPKLTAATATVNRPALAPLTPNAVTYSTVQATMSNLDAYELIDVREEIQTNANIRESYTNTIVYAINTSLDDLIVSQLTTATDKTSSLITPNVLDAAGLSKMGELLSLNYVPLQDGNMRNAVVSPGAMNNIVNDAKLVNAFYVDKGAVQRGFAQSVLGFDLVMSNRTTAGSGNHECYFYDKRAVGLAIAQDIEVRVDWRPDLGAWGFWAHMTAGSVIIDSNGIYKAVITD